jgi:hypothetical protein
MHLTDGCQCLLDVIGIRDIEAIAVNIAKIAELAVHPLQAPGNGNDGIRLFQVLDEGATHAAAGPSNEDGRRRFG